MGELILGILGFLAVVFVLLVLLLLMTYLYHLFLGVFPVIGIVVICAAVIAGIVIAIRSLIRAMRETYGRKAGGKGR